MRVSSTNEFLKKELSKSTPLPEGTVILAVDQYKGRGQLGATWYSEPGKNLTFSVLLKPDFLLPRQQFCLTAAVSLAVADWVEATVGVPATIKWPNDIYVGDRKIAGILIENMLKGRVWKTAILGIGINVNQTEFPDDIQHRTTSIKQILHRDCELLELLRELCGYLDREYLLLRQGKSASQLARYEERLYRRGVRHAFLVDGIRVDGVLTGVLESGRLRVDFGGHEVSFDIKEISFVV